MTDATTSFRTSLEQLRDDAHGLWQRACTEEQAAWELYRGRNFDYQQMWQSANDIRLKTQIAYDQLDRACKAAANTAATGAGGAGR